MTLSRHWAVKNTVQLFLLICPRLLTLLTMLSWQIDYTIGISEKAVRWISNYLSARTQCIYFAGSSSSFLHVSKSSILGPLLFSIYVSDLCDNLSNDVFHFYTDDTVVNCLSPSVVQTSEFLQSVFDVVQSHLTHLKLVLNA